MDGVAASVIWLKMDGFDCMKVRNSKKITKLLS